MNGHQFFQIWQFNQNFLVEIESVQSHRYSTEVSYYNVVPDTFKFYVLYIEKFVDDKLYITGYLYRQTADIEIVTEECKVNKIWIWTKNLILTGKHCRINILDEDSHPYVDSVETLKFHLCRPETFFKVGNNCKLYYGDGGECETDYQLYVCKNISIQKWKGIVRGLLKLGKERNDWNPKAPVLDIIDPDLYPVYYPEDEWIQNRIANISEEDNYVKRIIRRSAAQSIDSLILNDPAHERYKYHWKPISISIDDNLENVAFLTSIPGLPKTEEIESLQKDLTEVFQKMLPAFEAIGVVRKGIESKLQIVIKAQLYCIEPGTTFEGKWHTEGVTERIIAVGSYYASIDSFLDGGNLEFSLKNYPDEYYSTLRFKQNYESISIDKLSVSDKLVDDSFIEDVDVTIGTAIVFSNDLPHRFKKIINPTDRKGYRVFVNFFVIDPKHPLSVGDETCPLNETEILPQRERIREVLLQSPKGWGHIHYGNSGDVGYVDKNLFGQPIETFGDFSQFTE